LVGFRSGDLLRVALLKQQHGLAVGASSVVLLRAIELCSLLLFGAGWLASRTALAPRAWLLALALGVALLLGGLMARRLGGRGLLGTFAALSPRRLIRLLALACAAQAVEAAFLVGVALLLGRPLELAQACVLLAALSVGQLVAVLPANLGSFEASAAAGLALLGWSGPELWQLPALAHLVRLGASGAVLLVIARRSPPWELVRRAVRAS
jgi:hypothetical protein